MKLREKLGRLTMPGSVSQRTEATTNAEARTAAREQSAEARERTVDAPASERGCAELIGEIAERHGRIANLRARLDAMQMNRPAPKHQGTRATPQRAHADAPAPQRGDWFDDDVVTSVRVSVDGTLPGDVIDTAHGALCRVLTEHDEDHRHGSADVAPGRTVAGGEVALLSLDPTLAEIDFARALYIDTETTGLSGGAGTLPFLIGMAWFEGARLHVEQLLLPKPGLEVPLLARLAERLRAASVIVSYNGKSFDWPLLRTRFVLNRMKTPELPAHLDLLHCARRVYKSRLGSVRLVNLEQDLLGFERIDDVAGEAIPAMYLAFVRGTAAGATLLPIVEHNRSDLVALPALLGEIVRRFGAHAREDVRDQLSFARVAARGAEVERAITLAHAAADADVRGVLAGTALLLVGELRLRRGELDAAIAAFEGALAAGGSALERGRAHLALAKLHEHKTKRLDAACLHAAQTVAVEGPEASERRIARLTQRLNRKQRGRVDA